MHSRLSNRLHYFLISYLVGIWPTMSRHNCTFVIPAYNEARRLPATLSAIAALASSQLGRCEVIVADDGSTDATAELAETFRTPLCRVRVLRLSHRGKGFAIRRGVGLARGEMIVLCDADLADSVAEIPLLAAALRRGADIAIGSRWLDHFECLRSQPLHRRLSSRAFNRLATCVLSVPFKDTQCGLKALSRSAANRVFPLLRLDGWGYDAELIHASRAIGLRIDEVGLRLIHDYRDSHFRTVSDGWATVLELFEIRWNALRGAYRPSSPVLVPDSKPAIRRIAEAARHRPVRKVVGRRLFDVFGPMSILMLGGHMICAPAPRIGPTPVGARPRLELGSGQPASSGYPQ